MFYDGMMKDWCIYQRDYGMKWMVGNSFKRLLNNWYNNFVYDITVHLEFIDKIHFYPFVWLLNAAQPMCIFALNALPFTFSIV